jgi:hypothetical protein
MTWEFCHAVNIETPFEAGRPYSDAMPIMVNADITLAGKGRQQLLSGHCG